MKKTIILLLLSALGIYSMYAETDPKPIANSAQIRAKIIELLGAPKIEFEEDLIENTIHLMVTPKGTIVVVDVETSNKILDTYIKEKLNYKDCETTLSGNRFFSIVYKVEKK